MMRYKQLLIDVSNELDIPIELVNEIYRLYFLYIKETISSLPLKEDITEEEFLQLRTNFNLPSLGKLGVSLNKFNRLKKNYKK